MITVLTGRLFSAGTIAGAHTVSKILAFKLFLDRVEKVHNTRLEERPELFEEYLPYAVTLRVEKAWTQPIGKVSVSAPQCYQHRRGRGFMPECFIDDLLEMPDQSESVLASKPGS